MNALEIDLCSGATDPAMVASAAGSPRVTLRSRMTTKPPIGQASQIARQILGLCRARSERPLVIALRELPLVSQLALVTATARRSMHVRSFRFFNFLRDAVERPRQLARDGADEAFVGIEQSRINSVLMAAKLDKPLDSLEQSIDLRNCLPWCSWSSSKLCGIALSPPQVLLNACRAGVGRNVGS
jgi:hypothetical protein